MKSAQGKGIPVSAALKEQHKLSTNIKNEGKLTIGMDYAIEQLATSKLTDPIKIAQHTKDIKVKLREKSVTPPDYLSQAFNLMKAAGKAAEEEQRAASATGDNAVVQQTKDKQKQQQQQQQLQQQQQEV